MHAVIEMSRQLVKWLSEAKKLGVLRSKTFLPRVQARPAAGRDDAGTLRADGKWNTQAKSFMSKVPI